MPNIDPHDLDRFVQAQAPVYETVLAELRAGEKQTHWMWFVFPQLAGLGQSEIAQRYAIRSAAEAVAYLEHPVLGARLRECGALALEQDKKSARDIFGSPDDMKLRSCATLFAEVSDTPLFTRLLDQFFESRPDDMTLQLLAKQGPAR
jgi:uncharacterized protein (DUF1810 family)